MKRKAKLTAMSCVFLAIASNCYAAGEVTGSRDLPDYYQPYKGTQMSVTLDLEVDEINKPSGVIVVESVPAGWILASATPAQSSWDPNTGQIKWLFVDGLNGFTMTDTSMDITYEVEVPSTETGDKTFSGQILYNEPGTGNPVTEDIGGDTQISEHPPGPPSVAFRSDSSSGSEDISPASLPVDLSFASTDTVTVAYLVTGGTATPGGIDFSLGAGVLMFSPGETTENIDISITDDSLDEADETIVVTLTGPLNATLGANKTHEYTINDDDPTPTVEFATASSSGDEAAVAQVTLPVNLSAASGLTVTVNYSATGTATGGGTDYTLSAGPLTFLTGETTQDITITIEDDSFGEADETIVITLSDPNNATIGTNGSHTYTIVNDDASSVQFASASSSGPEVDSPALLTVAVLPAIPQTVTVDYSVTGGTAAETEDYVLGSGTLTFDPNETEKNIEIEIVDDPNQEPDETVIVSLSNPSSSATIGTPESHTYTIINDDDETPPETSGHMPQPNSVEVAGDTIIQLDITDAIVASTSGVDSNTVQIRVNGDLIYDGANETSPGIYDSTGLTQTVRGTCARAGTPDKYAFLFQPTTVFDCEQKVDVVIDTDDLAGNAMAEQTYHFYTAMRSFGENAKVNSDTGMLVQNRPATATDSAGNIWVVWDQTTGTGDTDIYVGQLEADAGAFGPSVAIVSDPNSQGDPVIAIDSNDVIYVAWQGDDASGMWDIFVSTSADGTSWSSPVKVNSGDPNNESNQTSPAIAIDQASPNKIYVVWQDERDGNKDVWLATSTDDGSSWTETQITNDPQDQSEPVVVIDANDVAYIAWTDWRDELTTGTDIYGAASDEGPWDNVPLVTTVSNQSSPVGALSSDGVVHLLWVDDANGDSDIFYGNDANGPPFVGTSIIDEPNSSQTAAAIAVRGTGVAAKVFACWQDDRNVVSDNGDTDIYFAESGSSFGTNILVNDDIGTNTQAAPAVGIDKNNNPYVVWVDGRNGDDDIYYAGTTAIEPPLATNIIVDPNGVTVRATTIENLQVRIPSGALPDGVDANDITIAEVGNPPAMPAVTGGFGVPYKFGPSGLHFDSPVTVRIPLTNDPGYSEYRLYRYDPSDLTSPYLPWTEEGIHNPATKYSPPGQTPYLEVEVDHFSILSPGGSTTGGAGAGGGGGDGGCALSAHGQGSLVEFMVPYIGFAVMLLVITCIDVRRRRTKCNNQ
jgi:hypothetical protein